MSEQADAYSRRLRESMEYHTKLQQKLMDIRYPSPYPKTEIIDDVFAKKDSNEMTGAQKLELVRLIHDRETLGFSTERLCRDLRSVLDVLDTKAGNTDSAAAEAIRNSTADAVRSAAKAMDSQIHPQTLNSLSGLRQYSTQQRNPHSKGLEAHNEACIGQGQSHQDAVNPHFRNTGYIGADGQPTYCVA